jgi:hypothetical protein
LRIVRIATGWRCGSTSSGRPPSSRRAKNPFLELGLRGIVGQVIQLSRRDEDRPDRDHLALRFEQFRKAA